MQAQQQCNNDLEREFFKDEMPEEVKNSDFATYTYRDTDNAPGSKSTQSDFESAAATEIAASAAGIDTSKTCLLMTSEDRYFLYRFEFLDDAKLSFTRTSIAKDGKQHKAIIYDLMVT